MFASHIRAASKRVLFVQATDPAGYPPLIHAATIMAEAGWDVTFLSAPPTNKTLVIDAHPRIREYSIAPRESNAIGAKPYAAYCAKAFQIAQKVKPTLVYASDPFGALPGLLTAGVGAKLIYHEHDSPASRLNPAISLARRLAARRAAFVVIPSAARARLFGDEMGIAQDRIRVIWNTPTRAELPQLARPADEPMVAYYHGSITPARLPEAVVHAMARYGERMRLMIAGYEAPGEAGYVDRLKSISNRVEYLGEVPSRTGLLQAAARAHIGLALMPPGSSDINMRHMTGASNKAFDYMAAGLGLLVSDLEDWNEMFARTGFARACNPADADSIAAAFDWFLANPTQRRGMGERGRTQIETAWNYDTQFKPLLGELCAPPKNQVAALQRRVRRADVSL